MDVGEKEFLQRFTEVEKVSLTSQSNVIIVLRRLILTRGCATIFNMKFASFSFLCSNFEKYDPMSRVESTVGLGPIIHTVSILVFFLYEIV